MGWIAPKRLWMKALEKLEQVESKHVSHYLAPQSPRSRAS